ncbi:MAG: polyprenyl synthetase family protein [Lachnospiraceae bacterium]|nr:polyprenyl synthetase family protein [Candidatus Minthocola equi]
MQTEDIIKAYLPETLYDTNHLIESMNYSVLVGGKRIRPTLMQETYKLFGGEEKVIEPFMAAIEFIHTYSLVHDDLPAMDGDKLRRGKETTWVKYGEAGGVLAGDALLTYAFEVAAEAFELTEHADRVAQSIRILADKAGAFGMVGGQALDLAADAGEEVTEQTLMQTYRWKTGALLEACMMIGATLAGAEPRQVAICDMIATDLGVAFQIKDDILDVTSTEEELGKPIGSDEKNHKTTAVTLWGLDGAKEKLSAIMQEVRDNLSQLPGDKESYFDPFLEYMESRNK